MNDETILDEPVDTEDFDPDLEEDIIMRLPPVSRRKVLLVSPERYEGVKQKIADLKAQLLHVRWKHAKARAVLKAAGVNIKDLE